MFATQTRRVFQPRFFKRLKINLPYIFRFSGTGGCAFMITVQIRFWGKCCNSVFSSSWIKLHSSSPILKKAISLLAHKPTTNPIRVWRFPLMRIFPRRLRHVHDMPAWWFRFHRYISVFSSEQRCCLASALLVFQHFIPCRTYSFCSYHTEFS